MVPHFQPAGVVALYVRVGALQPVARRGEIHARVVQPLGQPGLLLIVVQVHEVTFLAAVLYLDMPAAEVLDVVAQFP